MPKLLFYSQDFPEREFFASEKKDMTIYESNW